MTRIFGSMLHLYVLNFFEHHANLVEGYLKTKKEIALNMYAVGNNMILQNLFMFLMIFISNPCEVCIATP